MKNIQIQISNKTHRILTLANKAKVGNMPDLYAEILDNYADKWMENPPTIDQLMAQLEAEDKIKQEKKAKKDQEKKEEKAA